MAEAKMQVIITSMAKDIIDVMRLWTPLDLGGCMMSNAGCFSPATQRLSQKAWCQVLAGSLWRLPLLLLPSLLPTLLSLLLLTLLSMSDAT